MKIRYINDSDDKIAISQIYEKSWKHTYCDIIPQDYLDSIPQGKWVNTLNTPDLHTMVCIENNKYIGTISFCKSSSKGHNDIAEIKTIYFLPEYTGNRFGKILIKKVLEELKNHGYSQVFLLVFEENNIARKFYKNIGFYCTYDYLTVNIGGKNLRGIKYIYRFAKKI